MRESRLILLLTADASDSYFLTCAFKRCPSPLAYQLLPEDKPNAMTGVRVDWLTDTNLLRWIMTSDWLLCRKGMHDGLCSAMNSAKSNPFWQTIRGKNFYLCGSFSHCSIKLYLFFVLSFFTFGRTHCIPFDLTNPPLPPLSPPPRTCFYTHEWNRKWHFQASFVTHQSLLVCVMERKPSELWGSPSRSVEQGPLSVGRGQRSKAGFNMCNCAHAHIHLTLSEIG